MIGAIVVVLAIIGFFAFRFVSGGESGKGVDPKISQQYQQRGSTGYGQPPAGMTRPTGSGMGGQQGGYGGRPSGQGGYGGPGGQGPGGYGGGR